MNEFLLEYNNTITFSVEILAAVTGLLLYKKYGQSVAKFFILFLVYLSFCDFANTYVYYVKEGFFSFLKNTKLIRNFWWTTLYWKIGAICFLSFYYSKVLTRTIFKKVVQYSGLSFFLFSIIYIYINWEDYFVRFFPIISIFGAIIIFLCSVFYFIETLQSDKILSFYKDLNFYISAAIFIWWLIITPLIFYDIYNSHYDWNFIFLKWQIYLFANILMYSTFTFALIFCKPEEENIVN